MESRKSGNRLQATGYSTKGFTLVELLVAISIVAILSVIGLTAYNSVQARARDAKRLDDAKKIVTMIEKYYSEQQNYPDTDGDECPNPVSANEWCISSPTNTAANPWIPLLDVSGFPKGLPVDPINSGTGSERFYAYTGNGDDYCLQIPQETDASKNEYFTDAGPEETPGFWSGTWKLRFGPSGPNGGLCSSR